MKYPVKISWCDREPITVQQEDDGTVVLLIGGEAECLAALDRMERDMRATTRYLNGTIVDCTGDSLCFGMSSRNDIGYVTYQPRPPKPTEKGHLNGSPNRWSVSESAVDPNRRFGQPRDSTNIMFFDWEASYPTDLSTDHCVPLELVKRAVCDYLSAGTFSSCIRWAGYEPASPEEAPPTGRPVLQKR